MNLEYILASKTPHSEGSVCEAYDRFQERIDFCLGVYSEVIKWHN